MSKIIKKKLKVIKLKEKIKSLEGEILSQQLPKLKKKFVGKCFKKESTNCINPDQIWWTYIKIKEIIDEGTFFAENFDYDNLGRITFTTRHYHRFESWWTPVTNKQYKKKRTKILKKLRKL
jgi:hypothetical protein